jgi:hypothetical protein
VVPQLKLRNKIIVFLGLLGIVLYIVHMQMNFDSTNKYVTEKSVMSYWMRLLISADTALLICALFDYYQLQVWLFRKFETQDHNLIYSLAWPPQFRNGFLAEVSSFLSPYNYAHRPHPLLALRYGQKNPEPGRSLTRSARLRDPPPIP